MASSLAKEARDSPTAGANKACPNEESRESKYSNSIS